MNMLTICDDDNIQQTGGTRLVQEAIKSFDDIVEVTKKTWPSGFSLLARRSKFFVGIELILSLIRYQTQIFYFDSRMFALVFPVIFVARILKVYCVTTLQESHHLVEENPWSGISGKIRWALLRFVCRGSDLVIANSSITARLAIQEMGVPSERVKVIHPGFEPKPRSIKKSMYELDNSKRNVLVVGRYSWRKGIDVFLRALHHCDLKATKVIVVGDQTPGVQGVTYFSSLERLIPNECVQLRKKADTDTLQGLYEWAQVVVVPSRVEAFGIVVLEALWYGKTVVASDALPYEIRNLHSQVISFKSKDSEDLALKLQHALHLSYKKQGPLIEPQKWEWNRFQKELRTIIRHVLLSMST